MGHTRVSRKFVTAALSVGIAGTVAAGAASPAVAQEAPAPGVEQKVDVGVSIDPVTVVDSIRDAVNDQDDRGGAVRAGLDIAYTQTEGKSIDGQGPVTAVAIANKNQDINSEGQIWAEPIDIKGGNYVLYFYSNAGSLTNDGDGGWINWGAQGQINREDNVIRFD